MDKTAISCWKSRASLVLLVLAIACWAAPAGAQTCGAVSAGNSTISAKSLKIPSKAWEHFHKARLAAERHNDADFERESARALADAPDFAVMYLLRAATEVSSHEYTAAIASVAEARRIEPAAPWAGVLLASAYNGMSRFDDAAATIRLLHGTDATSWQAMHEMARAQVGLRHAEEALAWSERALATAPPNCSSPRLVHANALLVATRWSDAADELSTYLAASPQTQLRPSIEATVLRLRQRVRAEEVRVAMQKKSCAASAGACADSTTEAVPSGTTMLAEKGDPSLR